MYLHLVRAAAEPERQPRPAKVVQLDVRRKARAERALRERSHPRPAA
jgi:hypothetical protein